MTMIDNKKILELIKKKGLDKFQDDILNDLEISTSEIIKNKLKEYSNKNRIVKNDNNKISFPAKEVLNDVEIKKLPKWVREDIDNAIIIGESKNVIQMSNGKKNHLKNP